MAKKKTTQLSKKIRFEVFKRDDFKCQYCGKCAPDVILEVDHIRPKAEGGKNDIVNLITSCKECNIGKGKRKLDDISEIRKQYKELVNLADKTEQIKMMAKWREESIEAENRLIKMLSGYWCELIKPFYLTQKGENNLRDYYNKFGYESVKDGMLRAINYYGEYTKDGITQDSAEFAWKKIPGICFNRKLNQIGGKL
jgi:hypothetical protein